MSECLIKTTIQRSFNLHTTDLVAPVAGTKHQSQSPLKVIDNVFYHPVLLHYEKRNKKVKQLNITPVRCWENFCNLQKVQLEVIYMYTKELTTNLNS